MVKHLFGQTIQNINEIEIGARGQYILTHSDLRSAVTKKSLFFFTYLLYYLIFRLSRWSRMVIFWQKEDFLQKIGRKCFKRTNSEKVFTFSSTIWSNSRFVHSNWWFVAPKAVGPIRQTLALSYRAATLHPLSVDQTTMDMHSPVMLFSTYVRYTLSILLCYFPLGLKQTVLHLRLKC